MLYPSLPFGGAILVTSKLGNQSTHIGGVSTDVFRDIYYSKRAIPLVSPQGGHVLASRRHTWDDPLLADQRYRMIRAEELAFSGTINSRFEHSKTKKKEF